MFFHSWHDFLNMGGYGFYVWLSYGLTFVTLVGLGLQNRWRQKALIKELQREQQRTLRQQRKGV